jgi:hypothetical protein
MFYTSLKYKSSGKDIQAGFENIEKKSGRYDSRA